MPTIKTGRDLSPRLLATFALAVLGLASASSPAQAGGPIRAHFERFYGQDFYACQHPANTPSRGIHRQYDGGYYGPAMIYGRQYADEYATPRDQPFMPARFNEVYQDKIGNMLR